MTVRYSAGEHRIRGDVSARIIPSLVLGSSSVMFAKYLPNFFRLDQVFGNGCTRRVCNSFHFPRRVVRERPHASHSMTFELLVLNIPRPWQKRRYYNRSNSHQPGFVKGVRKIQRCYLFWLLYPSGQFIYFFFM